MVTALFARPFFFFLLLFSLSFAPAGADSGALVRTRLQVPEKFRTGALKSERHLFAPNGWNVSVFAGGLGGPRHMAMDEAGNIFVSITSDGTVVALPDRDRDGVADEALTFAEGLNKPHGLAFRGGDLIVAETGRIVSLKDKDKDLKSDSKEIITEDIPTGGGHSTRSIAISPSGDIFVSVGSSCNACVEKDKRRAAVLKVEGMKTVLYATGLRNSVGIAMHPDTGDLWGADNGTDYLGDDLPPEELNRIVEGNDYGWPYCYGEKVPDPNMGSPERCKDTIPAVLGMQAHSAPLGIAFGKGLKSPRFKDSLFIAFHGSWNRSSPTGYKVVSVPFKDGRPSGKAIDIITGWLAKDGPWGRPVQPLVGKDGVLYISDDYAGAIYRVVAEEGE
ncbi:MAG: PQQ-dependent sugar dehydrogenase [Deltaproteobacteria bacterium]|nr:PQQ-dependent sugar dehydrogenase [Deltaproteobacteria bacterium]